MKRFTTTDEIKIPEKMIDRVIGQEKAVAITRKAAIQHRHVLLIGEPGTGKTMLAQGMAELLSNTDMEDVLVYKNTNDENRPTVKVVRTYPEKIDYSKPLPDGQGRQIIQKEKMKNVMDAGKGRSMLIPIIIILVVALFAASMFNIFHGYELIVIAALIIGIFFFGSIILFVGGVRRAGGILPGMFETNEPKLIVDNTGMTHAPFVDGTGSKAGALFGDVRHDPLQSGGLGTPPHLRVESGAIHRANKGVALRYDHYLHSGLYRREYLVGYATYRQYLTPYREGAGHSYFLVYWDSLKRRDDRDSYRDACAVSLHAFVRL